MREVVYRKTLRRQKMKKTFKLPSLNEWAKNNYRRTDSVNEFENPGMYPENPRKQYNTVSADRFDASAFERKTEAQQVKEIEMRIKQFDDMQTKIAEMTKSFEEMMKDFISDKNDMWTELVDVMTDYEEIATEVRKELEDYKVTFRKAHTKQKGPGYKKLYEILMTKVNPATRSLMERLKAEQTTEVPVKPTLNVDRIEENLLSRVVDWFKSMYDQVMSIFRPAKDQMAEALAELKALKSYRS